MIYGWHACSWISGNRHVLWKISDTLNPYDRSHLSGQIYRLLSAIHALSSGFCYSNCYSRFYFIDLFSFSYASFRYASVWLYTKRQQPNVFAICTFCPFIGIYFCTYMLLTFTAAFFLSLEPRYTFSVFLLIHFRHYRQDI